MIIFTKNQHQPSNNNNLGTEINLNHYKKWGNNHVLTYELSKQHIRELVQTP